MPIPPGQLERRLVPRVLAPSVTVAELLYLFAEQPEPRRCFAVIRLGPDAYDALALDDLRAFSTQNGPALLAQPLAALPGLLRPGRPVYQSQIGLERAERELAARQRSRLVVLDDDGQVAGLLASVSLGTPKGISPLDLIGAAAGGVLGPSDPAHPAPAHLNTRFEGLRPGQPLVVGQRTPLVVAVGAPSATTSASSSRPFAFDFAGLDAPVHFTVHLDADPEAWTLRVIEPQLIVAPPGVTTQEAEFLVTARQPGRDKLRIAIERDGATVQHIWLPVVAAHTPAPQPAPAAIQQIESGMPLDTPGLVRPEVELTVQPGGESSVVVVRADLPGGMVRATYRVPVSGQAISNAALRLRKALTSVVFFRGADGGYPFADLETFRVDPGLARRACAPLADAGWQVWDMLFNAPRAPEGLRQLARDLRGLPEGTRLRVVLDSQDVIMPWALLYDAPGPITPATLDWRGFWGYRYAIEVFPPGRYPAPVIDDAPPGLLLLLNDDANLRAFTTPQEQFVRETLSGARAEVAWGHEQVQRVLQFPSTAALIYCYCHGEHESGALHPGALASESALFFGGQRRLRVADLRQLPAAPLTSRPLVFVNACEGATQFPFYYDGFMPFFIEQQLARGFIGTEVKAPQLLAHDLALQFLRLFAQGVPVGEMLWRLRRHYLDQHHNILGFNYSLYCPGDVRLARPLLPAGE